MSFFGELRRRNVVKVAVAYAIVGWLLIEVSTTVLPVFEAPDWIAQVFTFFVILGFPLALVLSWAYELTPEGIKADADVPRDSITPPTGQRLNYVIVGLLVLAVGVMFVDNYVLVEAPEPQVVLEEPVETAPPSVVEDQREVLPNSIAVLPLENISPDPNDAYFAAGIHEEILSQLAKIRDLNVIARTSVLEYPDSGKSIPEIADELNVEMIMEGSVRIAGDELRVTAQLIDGATNTHLWTEVYPGNLSDIFVIQAEIATAIAMALEAELLPSERESIEKAPTDSFEAYALYVRATDLRRSVWDSAETRSTMLSYLNQAIALDPEFALAYSAKADYYTILLEVDLGTPQSWLARRAEIEALAHAAAETALTLDPGNGKAESVLATLHIYHRREAAAREGFERALRLSPNDPNILMDYAYLNAYTGQHETAISLARRAVELDPNNPRWRFNLGDILGLAGDIDGAIETTQAAIALDPTYPLAHVMLGVLEAIRGNSGVALELLRKTELLFAGAATPSLYAELAYGYGRAGSREDAARIVRQLEETGIENHVGAGSWALAYLALRNEDEVLRWLETAAADLGPDEGFFEVNAMRANFWNDPILDEPEFVEVRSRLGFRE